VVALVGSILGAGIGAATAWLRTPDGASLAAAGILGSFAGLVVGLGAATYRAYRLTHSASGISSVSINILEVALLVLVVGGASALLVHFGLAPFSLPSARRFAPAAAAAIAAGVVACWIQ
jgi:hypothetical protein